jgi:hypothetical protein
LLKILGFNFDIRQMHGSGTEVHHNDTKKLQVHIPVKVNFPSNAGMNNFVELIPSSQAAIRLCTQEFPKIALETYCETVKNCIAPAIQERDV